jgi:hypothetical protein
MAAYLGKVAEDGFVFNDTVVAYVDANHKQVVIAYFGAGVMVHTGVDGDLLADGVVVADYKAAELGIRTKIEYLGSASDDATGKKMITFSDYHVFVDDDVGFEDGPFADCGAFTNKAVWADYDALLQLYAIFDNRCCVYLFHFDILWENILIVFDLL